LIPLMRDGFKQWLYTGDPLGPNVYSGCLKFVTPQTMPTRM
jgi:hypothetical protein